LRVYDPIVAWNPLWHPNVEVLDSPLAALDGVDALMIMTPWPEFKSIAPIDIVRRLKGKIILDPYGLLDRKFFARNDFTVHTLGICSHTL
jgi:UDPglucose 6-dehydrogenase